MENNQKNHEHIIRMREVSKPHKTCSCVRLHKSASFKVIFENSKQIIKMIIKSIPNNRKNIKKTSKQMMRKISKMITKVTPNFQMLAPIFDPCA